MQVCLRSIMPTDFAHRVSPYIRQAAAPHSAATATAVESCKIRFESVAPEAGIHFSLSNHGRSPLNILQTAGGGCAFLDYDSDGWPDVLLVGPYNVALYHNEHNGTFRDVTANSGLRKDRHWMGCAVGDYDGDGRPDVFLTGYHCCALYHNAWAAADLKYRYGGSGH